MRSLLAQISGLSANDPIADVPSGCNCVAVFYALRTLSIGACLTALVLTGCGDNESAVTHTISSPDGTHVLDVSKSDLGACCASRVTISGSVFGGERQQLAAIEGSSDVRYAWTDDTTLSIMACNATQVTYHSGFQNEGFTDRFILSVENERPDEDGDRVLCGSARFGEMTPL